MTLLYTKVLILADKTCFCDVSSNTFKDRCRKSEREGVQGGSETSNVVWVGDSGTDEKTGGGDGGGRVEDVAIFIRSDKNGQDQE